MKTQKVILFLLASMVFFISCNKEDDVVARNGSLNLRMTVWNAEYVNNVKGLTVNKILALNKTENIHTVDLVNVRHFIPKIEVTTDEIKNGVSPDDIRWLTIYESNEEMLHTDREVTIDIPAGNYVGFRITQRNLFYWVCQNQNQSIEFPAYNAGNSILPSELLFNYMGEDGLYGIVDGVLMLTHPDEKLGTFAILPNKTTSITMRMNILSIDWHDNDGSGDWSDGDALSNWTLPEGVSTMSDFLVTYE